MENLRNEKNKINEDTFLFYKEQLIPSSLPINFLQDISEKEIIYNSKTGDELKQQSLPILPDALPCDTLLQSYQIINSEYTLGNSTDLLLNTNNNNHEEDESKLLINCEDINGKLQINDNINKFDDVLNCNINPDEINIFEVGANVVIGLPEDMKSENTSELKDHLLSMKSNQDNMFKVEANRQNDVIKAAKSLFSKRTRTLFHWLFPNISKNALKSNVSDAWETLPPDEKHFYISQVLGKFGLHRSPLMINPQLDGLNKEIPTHISMFNRRKERKNSLENKKAVHDLISNYDEFNTNPCTSNLKRPNTQLFEDELEQAKVLKRVREGNDVKEDEELQSELDKYNLNSILDGESFWNSDIQLEL